MQQSPSVTGSNTEMEVKLQFSVFMLLIQVSLAIWQRVTVMKGQPLSLSCPITDAHKSHVDWKNPEGYIMFFNHNQALKDKRYSINKLSESEFSISISNVNFKDGGNYTCSYYNHHTTEKKVEVTVLGHPRMSVTHHDGKIVIKCTAEGNHSPPNISWKFDQGSEFHGDVHVHREDKKYVSVGMLHVFPQKKRVSLKCFVRHPALLSQPLMNFIKIGRDSERSRHTTTTAVKPQVSTSVLETTTSWFKHAKTTVSFTTEDVNRPSLASSSVSFTKQLSSNDLKTVTPPNRFHLNHVTSTGSHLSGSDELQTSVLQGSTRASNDTTNEATSTTGWRYVSKTTENLSSYNSTERTGSSDSKMQKGTQGNSSLLVLLVTCLIFGLLVVVIFFAIKLRRAHMAWKRENEDSDPSEESSKSKSSQEEKSFQTQRKRALFNTAFTQYVTGEPTTMSVLPESVNKEQTLQPQTIAKTSAKCDIKETSL